MMATPKRSSLRGRANTYTHSASALQELDEEQAQCVGIQVTECAKARADSLFGSGRKRKSGRGKAIQRKISGQRSARGTISKNFSIAHLYFSPAERTPVRLVAHLECTIWESFEIFITMYSPKIKELLYLIFYLQCASNCRVQIMKITEQRDEYFIYFNY